mmetsp:Transcript_82296/g.142604  ORF Transcript_82296/g.142604 Transcript_82296/m.142604 type:complete len:229 (-) Transcript_82296:124-810(-)
MFVDTRSTKKRSNHLLTCASPSSSTWVYSLKPPTSKFVCECRFLMLYSCPWNFSGWLGSAWRSCLKEVTYICRTLTIDGWLRQSGSSSSIFMRSAKRTGSSSCKSRAISSTSSVASRMSCSVRGRVSRSASDVISASRSCSSREVEIIVTSAWLDIERTLSRGSPNPTCRVFAQPGGANWCLHPRPLPITSRCERWLRHGAETSDELTSCVFLRASADTCKGHLRCAA